VPGGPVKATELNDCAADLAVTIVLALRKRILADGSGDGPDRANAAYKEWRGARVERLCTDAARRAFEVGVLARPRVATSASTSRPPTRRVTRARSMRKQVNGSPGRRFPVARATRTARRLRVRRYSRLKNGLGSSRA